MRNQPNFTFKNRAFFAICMLLLSVSALTAQAPKVIKLKNDKINSSLIANSDDDPPYHLLYSLLPTIYVKNNSIINITGPNKPATLTLDDANSLNILNTENPLFETVQIIKIQLNDISDLNKYVDFSALKGFDSLGYIHFTCYFDCNENQIRAFIKNINPEIITYFEYVKPA
jgi:hypothetical protein